MRLLLTLFFLNLAGGLYAQPKILSPAQMQADLHILHDAWTTLHPGLYRYNTAEQVAADFQNLQKTCALPLPESRFYLLLSQLAQRIKCGHTYLNPLNLDREAAARLLPAKVIPFFFRITDKHQLVITHTLTPGVSHHRGDEILAIDGIPVKRIMDSLLTVSRSDGRHALGKQYNNMNETPDEAEGLSLFDIYFPLFFNARTDQWTMDIRPYRSKTAKRYAFWLWTRSERMTAYRQLYGPVPAGEKSWAYRLLGTKTAYLKFGTFAFWNIKFDEKRFVDSAFRDIGKHPRITHLIIDIRGNEGGDNTGDYILSYLADRKLGCDDPDHRCYRFLTVPDTLLPYLHTWDKSFKAPKKPDDYFINTLGLYEQKSKNGDCALIEPRPPHFAGQVYLLCDAKNSSAGYQMAHNVQVNKLGTLVGETTGGSQQGINGGEFFFLTLPNSGIEIDLPLIFNYHPGKPDSGIVPEHPVPITQRDIARHTDAQLQYVLRAIKQKR